VTTKFSSFLCTPIIFTPFSRSIAESRITATNDILIGIAVTEIVYKPLDETEFEAAFDFFKFYMHGVIDETFGWDDAFQKKGFYDNYSLDWLFWVYRNNHKVGLVCARKASKSLHLHLLIVFEEYQRTGVATLILSDLMGKENAMTLSSFKNNLPAISLYQKMGFERANEDEHFYSYKADNYGNL